MRAATREFLRQRFGDYYRTARISVPPSLEQREWGFVFFDPEFPDIRMRRHLAFGTREELDDYVRNLVPAHAYFSTAYYASPSAPTMAEKDWAGADLIFDLDADHIMRGPYDRMLARVKEETEKIVGMLTDELGFAARSIEVVFSGGRGYHVHVRELGIMQWGASERRELVDYVCGIGLAPPLLLANPTPSPRGWQLRYIEALEEYLLWLGSLAPEEAISRVSGLPGVGKMTSERFHAMIPAILGGLRMKPPQLHLRDQTVGRVLRGLAEAKEGEFSAMIRSRAALADEPVTTDTKRLIRLPTSLHGGSGLRVTMVPLNTLPAFDPLTEAVVFSERSVRIESAHALEMPLLGSVHRVQKGTCTVPEALAVFLCARGIADIAG